MKRRPELHRLSADHHHALVLARRARQAAKGGRSELDQTWQEIRTRFARELEPHFRVEEEVLVPAMLDIGEVGLVQRLEKDHKLLRETVQDGADVSASLLERFGELLERHVRFEETQFFAAAQDRLGEDALHEIEEAAAKLKREP